MLDVRIQWLPELCFQVVHIFAVVGSLFWFQPSKFQVAQNYFVQAAEAGNANAMAFLGKVKKFTCEVDKVIAA